MRHARTTHWVAVLSRNAYKSLAWADEALAETYLVLLLASEFAVAYLAVCFLAVAEAAEAAVASAPVAVLVLYAVRVAVVDAVIVLYCPCFFRSPLL